jgi:acyl-CoA synthetase (AMP-forming)/AMP-acid ligase II
VRTELGTAKTPQHVVVLDDVPLTESGKVDYDALPDATDGTTEHEPPDGEVEQVLATVWSDVLDVERVGRSDDFMRLGGNSITAIQVTTRIESIFGIDLGVATVLTESTVAELTCVLIERSPNPERLRKAAAVFLRVQNMSKEKRDVLLQKARADRS